MVMSYLSVYNIWLKIQYSTGKFNFFHFFSHLFFFFIFSSISGWIFYSKSNYILNFWSVKERSDENSPYYFATFSRPTFLVLWGLWTREEYLSTSDLTASQSSLLLNNWNDLHKSIQIGLFCQRFLFFK